MIADLLLFTFSFVDFLQEFVWDNLAPHLLFVLFLRKLEHFGGCNSFNFGLFLHDYFLLVASLLCICKFFDTVLLVVAVGHRIAITIVVKILAQIQRRILAHISLILSLSMLFKPLVSFDISIKNLRDQVSLFDPFGKATFRGVVI